MTKDSKRSKTQTNEKSILDQLNDTDLTKISAVKDVCKTIPLIFNALIDIISKLDDANELKIENEKLANKVTLLESQICDLQNEKCKTKVTINGLAVKAAKKDKETLEESAAVIDKLLEDLDISDECRVTDVWRFPSTNPRYPPTMSVTFKSPKDHSVFFKSLKNLKKTDYEIFVSQVFPQCLLESLKILEKKAKEARKTPGCKSSIRYSKGQLHLFLKKGKGEWKKSEE